MFFGEIIIILVIWNKVFFFLILVLFMFMGIFCYCNSSKFKYESLICDGYVERIENIDIVGKRYEV